jgi:hypothetical protein
MTQLTEGYCAALVAYDPVVPSTEAPVDEGGFFLWPGDLPRSPVSFSNRSLVIVAIASASASRLIVLPMRRADQPSYSLFQNWAKRDACALRDRVAQHSSLKFFELPPDPELTFSDDNRWRKV